MEQPPTVAVLGLGSMGKALALRLLETCSVVIWNRSTAKTEAVAQSNPGPHRCVLASSPKEAISLTSPGTLVIFMLTDADGTISLIRHEGVGEALQQRTLLNLGSGNPDEGRKVAAVLAEISGLSAKFIDGAYCGNPSKARAGGGQLFLSSEDEQTVTDARGVLESLGSVLYCGKIGASRALDYAVVDLFFVSMLSFFSNYASLHKESVNMEDVFREAGKRLQTVDIANNDINIIIYAPFIIHRSFTQFSHGCIVV